MGRFCAATQQIGGVACAYAAQLAIGPRGTKVLPQPPYTFMHTWVHH